MNMYPTTLAPWYVVQQLNDKGEMTYYQSEYEYNDEDAFAPKAHGAIMFTNINSAHRVVLAEGGEIRVLCSKEDANEFGRA